MKPWISAAIFLLPALVQLCQAAPTTQPTVGYIVSPDGKPIAGAKVFVTTHDWPVAHILATTTTDADGLFHLSARTQPISLIVQASGFGLSPAQSYPSTQEAQESPSKLIPATILRVQVVNVDGKPASGIKIAPQAITSDRFGQWVMGLPPELRETLTQITDKDGMWAIEGLPADSTVRLIVLDDHFAQIGFHDDIHLSNRAISEGGVIHLKPACSISGHIVFRDSNQPVVGLRVAAQAIDGSEATGGFDITDAHGNYRIKQMSAGKFNVALDLQNDWGKQYTAVAHERLELTDSQQLSGIDFDLIHGGMIRGKVTVKGNERPVQGIEIGVYGPAHPRSGSWVQTADTGPDGSFILRVPPGDQYVYLASSPPPGLYVLSPSSTTLQVADNDTTEFNFHMEEYTGDRLTGKTVDPDGKPVPNAQILMTLERNDPSFEKLAGQSDANGNFDLVGVPTHSTLRARAGKLCTTEAEIVGQDHQPTTLVLHSDSISSARVHVVRDDGTAIPDATVILYQQIGHSSEGLETKQIDAGGSCIFKDLYPDEKYFVYVSASGFGHGYKNLNISTGEETDQEPIKLPKADSFITGTVVDEAGKPVADVQVETNSSASGNQKATSDASGNFKLENLVPGDKVLVFMRGSKLHSTQSVLTGTEGIRLTYQPKDPQEESK